MKSEAASDAYIQEMTEKVSSGEESPSEEEALEKSFSMLKDAIQESLGNVEYEDEQSATVRVELKNKVYTPNEDDVFKLEQMMFDIEAVTEAQ